MKISIAERLKPFSHLPGAACIIPGTCWEIEAFPTLLRFGKKIELKLGLTGPVEEFTLQQDLEKNCVWVFGKAKEGFYRLRIEGSDSGFDLYAEKMPPIPGPLKAKESFHIGAEVLFISNPAFERLSLGSHKSQDWDQVQRRSDLKEILPILFCLGQKIPLIAPQPLTGTARLLELPTDRNQAASALEAFLKAAFAKILVPRLTDDDHQGLVPEEAAEGNPSFLLQEGAKLVRSLFFKQNERRIKFLPHLPVPLDCGRMTDLKAPGIGTLDLEWSKKLLRRCIVRASTSGEVVVELQSELKTFRVRTSLKEKGRRQSASEPLLLEAGKSYYLDCFQK